MTGPLRPTRRALLLGVAALPVAGLLPHRAAAAEARLAALESSLGGRLGVAALDTANGRRLDHRADERFPFCSTFKVLVAAAILRRSAEDKGLLARRVTYGREDVVSHSPVTGPHAGSPGGLSVAELCAGTLQYSDNTAANLLMRLLGGPEAVTAFARSIGDPHFRLDRWETALNQALPGDPRDTTTPAAMRADLHTLLVGGGLGETERGILVDWMRGNTTGGKRIRAGLPPDWIVADKTGSGDYGTANDVAVVWPPARPPIVVAVYTTCDDKAAAWRDDMVAGAARIVAEAFA